MSNSVLHIDSSARVDDSITRALTQQIVAKLGQTVIRRDLADGVPQISEPWLQSNWTEPGQRTAEQQEALALSDTLIAELNAADTVVIGVPLYNFSIPAALKAWIDLVARAGITFRYTEQGPEGLLKGKRAILVVASGGVPIGAPMDFATPYMRQVLDFIGITDVEIVSAERVVADKEAALKTARDQIDALAA